MVSMKKKRDYTVPYSATDDFSADMSTLDGILDGLDDSSTSGDDKPEDTSGGDENSNGTDTQQNTDGDGEQDNKDQTQNQNQHRQSAKMNYAFMQMREQNAQLLGALQSIAKSKNIQYNNTQEMLAKLNEANTQEQAKNSNVPVELLQEIQAMRQQTQAFAQQQNQARLTNEFSQLMRDYGLSKDDLINFSDELTAKGVDVMKVNLVQEYKTMHQDEIITKMVDKRVEEILKRTNQADTNASTPNSALGGGGTGNSDKKIDTVAALDAALKDVKL